MDKEIIVEVGKRIREVRRHLQLNLKDFAAGLGVSPAHLSDLENGKIKPGHDFYYHIVKEFDVNLNYLFFGEEPMFRNSEQTPPAAASPLDKFRGEYTRKNEEVDEFLHYFFASDFFRYMILTESVSVLNKHTYLIEDEIDRKKSRDNK